MFDRFKQWLFVVGSMNDTKFCVLQPHKKPRKWLSIDTDGTHEGLKMLQYDNGSERMWPHTNPFLCDRG